MRTQFKALAVFFSLVSSLSAQVQNKDKAVYKNAEPGYFQNTIMKDDQAFQGLSYQVSPRRNFIMDQGGMVLPNKMDFYKNQYWHNPPVSQGNTNTCWSYSTTSFLESEVYRQHQVKVKLSEMYTVYWECLEKARMYVQTRGSSLFDEGSEANAVIRIWKKYGAVPEDAYTGLEKGRVFQNQEAMFTEMKAYLASVKANSTWDEEGVVSTIRSILDHYMGQPPTEVVINGKKITPLQYITDVLKINPDDYVDILSYEQEPFYKQAEYKVPDNWWHSAEYYNVPLNDFMQALKKAIRAGYTVSIGGDVSEPGLNRMTQCGMIPDFDIPSAYINDDARQFRFTNNTTTDDHGMHLVGYVEKDGKDWYLIKDSGSGSRNNDPKAPEFGYYFFSEDYVKLKMMDFMVHKDAVKDLLGKVK